jgi:hypothetical protein
MDLVNRIKNTATRWIDSNVDQKIYGLLEICGSPAVYGVIKTLGVQGEIPAGIVAADGVSRILFGRNALSALYEGLNTFVDLTTTYK